MRLTPARLAAAGGIVGIAAIVGVFLFVPLVKPVTIKRPVAPPSITAIRDRWDYDILLPTDMPACLRYDSSQTGIVDDDSASNGLALGVTLVPDTSGGCSGAGTAVVRISEAPAFKSLGGSVSTVTQGRMQFARVVKSTAGGQTEVTLQWHCASMMCRVTGTLGGEVTETELAKMADSFEIVRPNG